MRHQPGLCAKPVALIEEQEKKPVIIQLNDVAEKAGIYQGMTPSQALARSLQVVIKVRARTQEKSIQEILLHYAFTLTHLWKQPRRAFAPFNSQRGIGILPIIDWLEASPTTTSWVLSSN